MPILNKDKTYFGFTPAEAFVIHKTCQQFIPNNRFHTVIKYFNPDEEVYIVFLRGHPSDIILGHTGRRFFTADDNKYGGEIARATTVIKLLQKVIKSKK